MAGRFDNRQELFPEGDLISFLKQTIWWSGLAKDKS